MSSGSSSTPKLPLLAIGLALLLSGCVGGFGGSGGTGVGGLSVPDGFEETKSPPVTKEGISAEAYTGDSSASEALAAFEKAAEEAGWSSRSEGGSVFSFTGGGAAASGFERGDEVLLLQVTESGSGVTVLVVVGPKSSADSSGDTDRSTGSTPEATSKESPPTTDVEGTDVPDVPRYPGSVRIDYGSIEGEQVDTLVTYVTRDGTTEVATFYQDELPGSGWTGIKEFQSGERHVIEAEMDGRSLSISLKPSPDYEGYSDVIVHHAGAGN